MTTSNENLTANQTITITLASLGSGSSRQSTALNNSSNLYFDAGVMVIAETGGGGVSSTGTLNVYAYGSANGGTNYTDGASGSDSAFTPTSPTNLKQIGIINAVDNSTTYYGGPFSVAAAFGYLPGYWGIVVTNNSGAALAASGASAFFEGQKVTSA
jgi:hypothetical protein